MDGKILTGLSSVYRDNQSFGNHENYSLYESLSEIV